MTTITHRGTVNDNEFAALCNLFRAYPVVCDESRTLARVVLAYLGLEFAGSQPRHQPGSGCKFADADGNCDFHDVRHANALVSQVREAMLGGRGSLPDGDNEV